MKIALNLYIERQDLEKLKQKAVKAGYNGKGSLSHYITKIAREPICFLDENVMALIKAIKIK